MEIILVRHGEPAWVTEDRVNHDPRLTPLGVAQATAVASRLAAMDGGIDEILVSPARRALETAEPLERTLAMQATTIADLTEIRTMNWDDTPQHVVEQAWNDARDRPLDQWWDGMEGGETFRDFHFRVTDAIDAVLRLRGVRRLPEPHLWHDDQSKQRIVVFGHGGTNAVVMGHLLDLDPTPWEWERFVSHHGATMRLRTTPLAGEHVMSLWEANGTSHLSQEYLTR